MNGPGVDLSGGIRIQEETIGLLDSSGIEGALRYDGTGRDSLNRSSGIETWANGTMTIGSTSASSPSGCTTHRILDPVSSAPQPLAIKPTREESKADVDPPDHDTRPDLSASQFGSSNEGGLWCRRESISTSPLKLAPPPRHVEIAKSVDPQINYLVITDCFYPQAHFH